MPQAWECSREMAMPILAKLEGAVLMNDPMMLGANGASILLGYIHHLEECVKFGASATKAEA